MKVRSLFMLFVFVLMAEGGWAKSPAPTQVDGATTVSTKRAKILMNQGVIFIDVRRVTDFQTSRIQWAEHLDLKLDLTEESLLSVVKKINLWFFIVMVICVSAVQLPVKKPLHGAGQKCFIVGVVFLTGKTRAYHWSSRS